MLYSRTFHVFDLKSHKSLKRILKLLFRWIGTSRFSAHFVVLLLSFLILVFLRATPYYSFSQEIINESDVWGEYEYIEEGDQEEALLAFQVSNDAVVKPYVPYTEESAFRKPEEKQYLVQVGDTYKSVAEQFSVTEKALRSTNQAGEDDELVSGKTIIIPIPKGMWYTVAEGDTVVSISKKFDLEPEYLITQNDIVDPEGLAVGRRVVLPGVFPTQTPLPPPTPKPTKAVAKSSSTTKKTSSTKSTSKQTITETAAPPSTNARFGWPVNPDAVFQSQRFWSKHPAVDLASKGGKNVPIYASAGGKVVHASWSTRGYGNMVLIDHGNGFHTLYGHFSKIIVTNGQSVKRGQVLGYMGTTGYSTGVHLHFEICTNGCEGYSTATRLNPRRFF